MLIEVARFTQPNGYHGHFSTPNLDGEVLTCYKKKLFNNILNLLLIFFFPVTSEELIFCKKMILGSKAKNTT